MVEYEIEYTRVTAGNTPVRIPWGNTQALQVQLKRAPHGLVASVDTRIAMLAATATERRHVRLHEVDGSHAYNSNRGKRRGLVIYGR